MYGISTLLVKGMRIIVKKIIIDRRKNIMPHYYFREVWTPLKFIGIRLFRDNDRHVWIKYWNKRSRRFRS
jgi:hypothetical protein